MTFLWTEKYRPKDITSFISKPHIKALLSSKERPNLLLYGPPGTGKTTFAHLLSKNKLELNASDDRGINVIRDKIKSYANTLKEDKTIILDECENLTEDAQHCLRRIIEDSKNTRFIFTTNYLSKVIGPLKSRLVKIKFECSFNCLEVIGKKEKLNFSSEFYDQLFKKCNNDLRRSINVLQAIKPNVENNTMIDSLDLMDIESEETNQYSFVDDIIGLIPNRIIEKFVNLNLQNYKEFIKYFINQGYFVLQLIYQLQDVIVDSEFYILMSEMEEKLIYGCSEEIVLTKMCLWRVQKK